MRWNREDSETAQGSQGEHQQGRGRLEVHVVPAASHFPTGGPGAEEAWRRGGAGHYYHVGVRPKKDSVTFRTQDVGEPGHVQRVAGKRGSGSWDTVKWLISKPDAHINHDELIPDTDDAKEVLAQLGSRPVHVTGDIFEAKPLRDVPEREKPTLAQARARSENIKRAQAARHARSGAIRGAKED